MSEKNKELEELKNKCEEYLGGWKRERADFLNYKKEEAERISQLAKFANQEIVLKLLPILDNFCLATRQNVSDLGGQENIKNFFDGVVQIKKQLEDLLAKEGIEAIEVLDKPFDPAIMEAAEEIESDGGPTFAESGTVVEELQRGYKMHGKIIRVARVKIAK